MFEKENVFINDIKCVLDNYKDLLSANDLAEIFETTKDTIYKEIKRGKFGNPIKIGHKYKIPKTFALERFFNHQ